MLISRLLQQLRLIQCEIWATGGAVQTHCISHGLVCQLMCYFLLQEGLKRCLADFRKDLPWVERLDMTNPPAEDILSKMEGKAADVTNGDVSVDDDFQREMFLWVTRTLEFVGMLLTCYLVVFWLKVLCFGLHVTWAGVIVSVMSHKISHFRCFGVLWDRLNLKPLVVQYE